MEFESSVSPPLLVCIKLVVFCSFSTRMSSFISHSLGISSLPKIMSVWDSWRATNQIKIKVHFLFPPTKVFVVRLRTFSSPLLLNGTCFFFQFNPRNVTFQHICALETNKANINCVDWLIDWLIDRSITDSQLLTAALRLHLEQMGCCLSSSSLKDADLEVTSVQHISTSWTMMMSSHDGICW